MDPTPVAKPKVPVLRRLGPILALTLLCWVMLVLDLVFWHGQLAQHGIVPRRLASLPAVLWSPFLHGSSAHLGANTLPLLVLGGIVCLRSQGEFVLVTVMGIIISGALTWLIGRNGSHIGASGLIFCYFGYLASLAVFERKISTLLISLACIVVYGGILRGLTPTTAPISWEGHLAGLAAGVVLAWFISKVRRTPLEEPAPSA